jgi:sugar phosphate permease
MTARRHTQNYAFVVAGVIFFSLMIVAGLRSAPSVLIMPLERAFGWEREILSLSASIGILLFGLMGPFAGALMQSVGLRRTVTFALLVMSGATSLSAMMSEPWQYIATWGVLSGLASGCVAPVLGATVVNRWFVAHRGLMLGLLSAAGATGTLGLIPIMAVLSDQIGWHAIVLTMAILTLAMAPFVWFLVPENPAAIGQRPYGAPDGYRPPVMTSGVNAVADAFGVLGRAARTRTFWLLFGGFFVCGLTTNGLVGTHMIALCSERGLTDLDAAGLLAIMGLFDLIGTTASGYLTDRYDPRKLLFIYYAVRGIALMLLPFSDFSMIALNVFAVFYGLDWIATVPPTAKLSTEAFGDRDGPIVFGWVLLGHQVGAATAAIGAGLMHAQFNGYLEAFVLAGATGIFAALISLLIKRPAVAA